MYHLYTVYATFNYNFNSKVFVNFTFLNFFIYRGDYMAVNGKGLFGLTYFVYFNETSK